MPPQPSPAPAPAASSSPACHATLPPSMSDPVASSSSPVPRRWCVLLPPRRRLPDRGGQAVSTGAGALLPPCPRRGTRFASSNLQPASSPTRRAFAGPLRRCRRPTRLPLLSPSPSLPLLSPDPSRVGPLPPRMARRVA
ncbi:hypothetical protein BS78_04G048600 [Paspalum vaginatum]|nr:hypothetical protein BS78_04G048600 [Paspalum vaginatum]